MLPKALATTLLTAVTTLGTSRDINIRDINLQLVTIG